MTIMSSTTIIIYVFVLLSIGYSVCSVMVKQSMGILEQDACLLPCTVSEFTVSHWIQASPK